MGFYLLYVPGEPTWQKAVLVFPFRTDQLWNPFLPLLEMWLWMNLLLNENPGFVLPGESIQATRAKSTPLLAPAGAL